jgi:hypothetical protein
MAPARGSAESAEALGMGFCGRAGGFSMNCHTARVGGPRVRMKVCFVTISAWAATAEKHAAAWRFLGNQQNKKAHDRVGRDNASCFLV